MTFTVILLTANITLAAVASPGTNYSCDDVRGYVAAHGKAHAWAKALEMVATRQMTWGQLQAARKCLRAQKG